MGRIDMKGLFQSVRTKDYLKCVFQTLEYDLDDVCQRSSANQMFKVSVIFDMEHLSMRQITHKAGNR